MKTNRMGTIAQMSYQRVCLPCVQARRRGLDHSAVPAGELVWINAGRCDCCGRQTGVAHVRSYGYPWHPAGPKLS